MYDKYEEVDKIIEELRQELKYSEERRILNIFAGVCNKSIKTQDKKIENLQAYIKSLEKIHEQKLLDC